MQWLLMKVHKHLIFFKLTKHVFDKIVLITLRFYNCSPMRSFKYLNWNKRSPNRCFIFILDNYEYLEWCVKRSKSNFTKSLFEYKMIFFSRFPDACNNILLVHFFHNKTIFTRTFFCLKQKVRAFRDLIFPFLFKISGKIISIFFFTNSSTPWNNQFPKNELISNAPQKKDNFRTL